MRLALAVWCLVYCCFGVRSGLVVWLIWCGVLQLGGFCLGSWFGCGWLVRWVWGLPRVFVCCTLLCLDGCDFRVLCGLGLLL